MSAFGDFLYSLRKEKGLTQAALAQALGVTNKAVSKWETGEAMPETSLLLPLSEILGVTVDELLSGRRADGEAPRETPDPDFIKNHLFTRGKEDEQEKTVQERVCGAICAAIVFFGVAAYLTVGLLTDRWSPFWVVVPVCALSSGIVGIFFDLADGEKRSRKFAKGENPYVGAVCGTVMLVAVSTYLCLGAFLDLWHPYWIILVVSAFFCALAGAIGGILLYRKNRK